MVETAGIEPSDSMGYKIINCLYLQVIWPEGAFSAVCSNYLFLVVSCIAPLTFF